MAKGIPTPIWRAQQDLILRRDCERQNQQKWARYTVSGLSEQERSAQLDERLGAQRVFADAIAGAPGYIDFLLRRNLPVPVLRKHDGQRPAGPDFGSAKAARRRIPSQIRLWRFQYGPQAGAIFHSHPHRLDATFQALDAASIPVPLIWQERDRFPRKWAEFSEKDHRRRATALLSSLH